MSLKHAIISLRCLPLEQVARNTCRQNHENVLRPYRYAAGSGLMFQTIHAKNMDSMACSNNHFIGMACFK
jgi:hypothetical protein